MEKEIEMVKPQKVSIPPYAKLKVYWDVNKNKNKFVY